MSDSYEDNEFSYDYMDRTKLKWVLGVVDKANVGVIVVYEIEHLEGTLASERSLYGGTHVPLHNRWSIVLAWRYIEVESF